MTAPLLFAWLPTIGDRSERAAETSRHWLQPEEQERMERFVRDADRRLFLLARFLARGLLADATQTSPEDWRFELGPHDRPIPRHDAVDPAATPDCNWSHTDGLACAVLGTGRVGTDTERLDRRTPTRNPRRFLTAPELQQCQADDGEIVAERFWRIWTLKEAWLKCTGTGVAGGLQSVSLRIDRDEPCFECGGASNAKLFEIRPNETHTCAIASNPLPERVSGRTPDSWDHWLRQI
ncbi:MAG: 4'-phosphopantetheinyl transferase superfamily protein [Planctomycetota bacterium]